MRSSFYSKLAWDAIRKNKRMYFPYILTGSVMVMMYYILSYLIGSSALESMPGGSVLMTMLPLGCVIIAFFSLLFLFYTNSLLIKQRYREFGLYNILGMDKKNISRLMVWETLFSAAIAIIAGLVCGIGFSKAAELVLLNLLNMDVDFMLSISSISIRQTAMIYSLIYLLLLVNALLKVRHSKPLELMQKSRAGEKLPKFTWPFALLGVVLLGGAYYLAVSIKEPVTALVVFFIAVLMVIVGTYLLFISGSVTFCRMLQRNKRYYYKPEHFVSVSSMVYRMKRNGAGLASICILLTMVLVMLSSTTTLYFGEEGSLRNRYPNEINIDVYYDDADGMNEENLTELRDAIAKDAPKDADLTGTCYTMSAGMFTDDGVILDYTHVSSVDYDKVGYLYIVSIDDYNSMMKTDKTLKDDECFIYSSRLDIQWSSFTMEYCVPYNVKERLTEFHEDKDAIVMTMPSAYIVVNNVSSFIEPVADRKNDYGASIMEYNWTCGFDCEKTSDEVSVRENILKTVKEFADKEDFVRSYNVVSREMQKFGFYELYGSLFFLGIMLSIVFLLAAVLIIYYKQLSEGYEDQNRFEIMQKVGMTKRDIRKSINSQMLTVFFMPLVMAGIHLAFAYPFISKIMLMFAFDDTLLNVAVTAACFAVFGIFYAVVYKMTSGSYYNIVCGKREA